MGWVTLTSTTSKQGNEDPQHWYPSVLFIAFVNRVLTLLEDQLYHFYGLAPDTRKVFSVET